MSATRGIVRRACSGTALLLALSGCSELSKWASALGGEEDPAESAGVTLTEVDEDVLPKKPPTSTARSETGVITFRSVLESTEMTREERIRAFQKLDPGALQKPVARANVSRGPRGASVERSRDRAAPSEPKVAAARRRVPIVMYSTAWCGVCRRARAYFQQNRIPFEEHDVDEDPVARAEYERLNPRRSVPTMKIGDEVIIGFSAAAVERALDNAAKNRLN